MFGQLRSEEAEPAAEVKAKEDIDKSQKTPTTKKAAEANKILGDIKKEEPKAEEEEKKAVGDQTAEKPVETPKPT